MKRPCTIQNNMYTFTCGGSKNGLNKDIARTLTTEPPQTGLTLFQTID